MRCAADRRLRVSPCVLSRGPCPARRRRGLVACGETAARGRRRVASQRVGPGAWGPTPWGPKHRLCPNLFEGLRPAQRHRGPSMEHRPFSSGAQAKGEGPRRCPVGHNPIQPEAPSAASHLGRLAISRGDESKRPPLPREGAGASSAARLLRGEPQRQPQSLMAKLARTGSSPSAGVTEDTHCPALAAMLPLPTCSRRSVPLMICT